MPEFLVPVYVPVVADGASEAKDKVWDTTKNITRHEIGSPKLTSPAGDVEMTKYLKRFLNIEVEQNDDDPSGYWTDLDDIRGTLEQMPDDLVCEQAGYGDRREKLAYSEFADELRAEFKTLYNKYGGGTTVNHLFGE